MNRIVQPEWLDRLPPDDPAAQHSRGDLVRLNRIMGNATILARMWKAAQRDAIEVLADVGTGDGILCLRVVRSLPERIRPKRICLVDRLNLIDHDTRAAFEQLGCIAEPVQGDVLHWLKSAPRVDLIMANLVLHHFPPEELSHLLRGMAARSDAVLAVEPRRSRGRRAITRLLGWIGCNWLTRHDAAVSVSAGFTGRELSQAWPVRRGWSVEERSAGLFSHVFLARRL